jgi:hypothetical protein
MKLKKFTQQFADTIGIDPWDVSLHSLIAKARHLEESPVSRFRWGSPCRFIRSIDLAVHVVLPAMLEEKYPELATYLRSTSPRWGRRFREW